MNRHYNACILPEIDHLPSLSEIYQNRNYQFWILQFIGWMGWVSLFALRDAYWGQPYERIFLLVVDAIAGASQTAR